MLNRIYRSFLFGFTIIAPLTCFGATDKTDEFSMHRPSAFTRCNPEDKPAALSTTETRVEPGKKQKPKILSLREMGFVGEVTPPSVPAVPAAPISEQNKQESWEKVELNANGYIITPWNNDYLKPDTVFDLLKDDEKNRLKVPAAVWRHVLNCVQFQHSYVTRTNQVCLKNAEYVTPLTGKLLSPDDARLQLLALQQGGYDLGRIVPKDVLAYLMNKQG